MNFVIQSSGKLQCKLLNLRGKRWPIFEKVSKKVPVPRTFQLLLVTFCRGYYMYGHMELYLKSDTIMPLTRVTF
jgi:hypothetical protein